MDQRAPTPPLSEIGLPRILVLVSVFVGLFLLAYQLSQLLLLVFGAVIVATVLRGLAEGLRRWCRVPQRWALTLAGLLLVLMVAGTAYLLGSQIQTQAGRLGSDLAANFSSIKTRLAQYGVFDQLRDVSVFGTIVGNVTSLGTAVVAGLADALLVIAAGIYFAVDPQVYRHGLVLLFPPIIQARVDDALQAAGQALGQWLLAQLIAMLVVGVLSGIGLWIIGVPSPLALGLIAGVMEFIPFLGPWLGALPALLVASSEGSYVLVWTALLYLAIQQVEAIVISPLLAKRLVSVPPAVGLFAVVAFGVTFGSVGVLLAFPLTVVTMALVVKLYVQPELHEDVAAPGEDNEAGVAARLPSHT